jgi:hypothetical protein
MTAFRVESEVSPLLRVLADHPEFITDRAAARMCRVGLKMIYCWIETSLWPLPLATCHNVFLFKRADVECWLGTGKWSRNVSFRKRRARR